MDVATEADAARAVPFVPIFPRGLGTARIVVTNPESSEPAHRVLGLVYDHPTFGRFWVIQNISSMTQADLEAWTDCDPDLGCEGRWTLVDLPGGRRGMLIEGSEATSVVWLDGEVMVSIMGPARTFARFVMEAATAVATTPASA